MTRTRRRVGSGILAAEALRIMEERHISALIVLDDDGALLGVVNLLGLLEAGSRERRRCHARGAASACWPWTSTACSRTAASSTATTARS
jgi:CBS-domain-containing membrane protein